MAISKITVSDPWGNSKAFLYRVRLREMAKPSSVLLHQECADVTGIRHRYLSVIFVVFSSRQVCVVLVVLELTL